MMFLQGFIHLHTNIDYRLFLCIADRAARSTNPRNYEVLRPNLAKGAPSFSRYSARERHDEAVVLMTWDPWEEAKAVSGDL